MLHAPQWLTSSMRSTQLGPHWVNGVHPLFVHWPAEHTCPAGHALPQLPQLPPSDWMSTQLPAQFVRPVRHVHVPRLQVSPVSQAVPQAPQFVGLLVVSTQPLPHATELAGHAQPPFEQL